MISDKRFQKKIENFVCENCGNKIIGNGYTNHCPNCIWSKHVDINPGDRAETCNGLMKPDELISKNNAFFVVHKCLRCGFKKKNKIMKEDNFDELIKLSNAKNM